MDAEQLLDALRRAVRLTIGDERRVAVAWSGGVDSAVIAALARETADVTRYMCAVRGGHDWNLAQSLEAADREGLVVIELNRGEILRLLPIVASMLDSTSPVALAYTIPIVSVLGNARERLILTGGGADELFGGYAKYESMDDPRDAMGADLGKMLDESAKLRGAARSLGKELGLPFVTEEVMGLARAVPTRQLLGPKGRKLILREAAAKLGVALPDRPKKAAQYSAGTMREMERIAKEEGLALSDWVKKAARANRATA